MQGVELVNHWLLGEAEETWKDHSQFVKIQPALTISKTPVAADSIAADSIAAEAENAAENKVIHSTSGHGLIKAGRQPLKLKHEGNGKVNGKGKQAAAG
jgi:hypothetical protein